MTYESWRITFQSAEQAARSAYAEIEALKVERNAKGYVVVPREPTREMLLAAFHAEDESTIPSLFYQRIMIWYKAMLSAAEGEK